MIRGETLTAVIPVRAGSKGIPGKNLYRIQGGDTLLERSIKLALACPFIDRILVSTDSDEMYEIAKRYDVAPPSKRPPALAHDTARTIDVVAHVLDDADVNDGYVLLLQVTSPLRTLADLNQFCQDFETEKSAKAIVSLVRFDAPHPDKIQKIDAGRVESYLNRESMVARQQLPPVYALNGAFYLTHREVIVGQSTFMPKGETMPFLMPEERSLNLDGPRDLFLLECLLSHGKIALESYD